MKGEAVEGKGEGIGGKSDVEMGGGVLAAGLLGPGCLRRERRHLRGRGWQCLFLSVSVFTSLALRLLKTAGAGELALQAE